MFRFFLAVVTMLALTAGAWANAAEDRVYLDLTVNGVAHDPTFAVIRSDDVLIPLADAQAAGAPATAADAQPLFGQPYVSLRGLSRMLTYTVDTQALQLHITLNATAFKPVAIDASANPPLDAERIATRAVAVNYGLYAADAQALQGSLDARWNINADTVFETTGGRTNDGTFQRGLTQLDFESPANLRRTVVGDSLVSAGGDFGGSAVLGGVDVRRAFDENPYLSTIPLPSAQTTVLQPSTADVYVNGVRVKTIDLAPGTYDLNNLPLQTGLAHAQVVIRNAFGGQNTIFDTTTFVASGLLRKGLTDYNYGLGFARVDYAAPGDTYGSAIAAGAYRLGLTDSVTTGAGFESTAGQTGGGVSFDGLVGRGALHVAAAASTQNGLGGNAETIAYSTSDRVSSFVVQYLTESPNFTTLGLHLTDDRPESQWNANLTHTIGQHGTLVLGVQSTRSRDADPLRSGTLQYLATIGNDTFAVGVTRRLGNFATEATNQISLYFSHRTGIVDTQSVSYDSGPGNAGPQVQIQHNAATPLDTQYSLTANGSSGIPLAGTVQFGLPALTIGASVNGAISGAPVTGSVDVNGAVVFADGATLFSQQIGDAYGIVRAPGIANAGVYANNLLVTKTDGHGDAVIPSLGSYQANRIGISTASLPYDQIVSGADRSVIPGYRGAALVRFGGRTIHDVTGSVRAADGPIAYGQIVASAGGKLVASSPTDERGRFYFEELAPGTYAATVTKTNGTTCATTVTVPKFVGVEWNVGTLTCAK